MWQKIKCWLGKIFPKPRTVLARADLGGEWFRFKVHEGNQIYLHWFGYTFPLELQEDGSTICKKKGIRGYNKPYYWHWMEDDGRDCRQAEL